MPAGRIFVSIAAYRDPELVPTIASCLETASDPGSLRFGIAWQHGEEEDPLPYLSDSRFQILDIPWWESRGACWARSYIQSLYAGEPYYLQLDSHHRFADGWDALLLEQMAATGSPKPVLTSYVTPYCPTCPSRDPTVMQMNFDRFTPEGIVLFRPGVMPEWQTTIRPRRARFLSAHFLFTLGSFVRDVPYDPLLYFTGEEITLAIRAFSHGYDLFHPGLTVCWHEYTREYRMHKHWSDHIEGRLPLGGEAWWAADRRSKARIAAFLARPWVGSDGLGTARTLADYEAYAGLDISKRQAQVYTKTHHEPPNPPADPGWADSFAEYTVTMRLNPIEVPATVPYDFWFVGCHDADGVELYRQDADAEEVAHVLSGVPLEVIRSFTSDRVPTSWTVWPHSPTDGWLTKRTGPIS